MKSFKQYLREQQIDNWCTLDTIEKIWEEANDVVFRNQLTKPKFTLEDDLDYLKRRYPNEQENRNGHIVGYCDKEGSKYILRFCKPMFRNAHDLMCVVVHEMVHQAEAERTSYLKMCADPHGRDFFAWSDAVYAYHHIELKEEQ